MQQTDHPLIVIDPDINMGQPTIKGTNLTVAFVVEKIIIDSIDETTQWLLETYPQLTKETITAAMHYHSNQLRQENSYPCPCCGYLMFDKPPGSFDICPICFWEDDAMCLDPLLSQGGANKVSLLQGQQNYLAFGACEEQMKPHTRPPLPDERQTEGWRPIDPAIDIIDKILKDRTYQTYVNLSFLKDRSSVYYWSPTYWRRVMRPRQDLSSQQTPPSNEETI